MPVPKPRFRVAIVGGGIAGLTLAVVLGRYEEAESPLQIDMYEAGPEITTVGAGISVWPRTWDIMRELELYDEMANEAVKSAEEAVNDAPRPAFIFRKSDWPREGYDFARVTVQGGATTMHRADMVEVLMRHLSRCTIHTSKRLVNYSETTTLRQEEPTAIQAYLLHFADGTDAEADVVIGADGIKSKTRAAMYEYAHARECTDAGTCTKEECERCSKATPKWTGTVAYRHLIPSERLCEVEPKHSALKKGLMSYCGKGKHIITFPISHGRFLNWVGFVTIPGAKGTTYPHKWVIDATREDAVRHFLGWEPEVDRMLACIEKPTLWAIHIVEDLPFSVNGRVALMGDAVHAMTPHFGAGGGQAIEDAYILGRLLADPRTTLSNMHDIFRIYQDVRLPFARAVVQNTGEVGLMYEFDSPGLYDGSPEVPEEGRETTQLDELGHAIEEKWTWQSSGRVGKQWEDAQKRLEMLVGPRRDPVSVRETEVKDSWKHCLMM